MLVIVGVLLFRLLKNFSVSFEKLSSIQALGVPAAVIVSLYVEDDRMIGPKLVRESSGSTETTNPNGIS